MRAKICFQDSFEKEPQTVKKVHNIFAYWKKNGKGITVQFFNTTFFRQKSST
jgi:hypothetical protein